MIKLNYQTHNFAHGDCGIKFLDWEEFSFILGFLSNIKHYRDDGENENNKNMNGSIDVYKENNQRSGAKGSEGRILYIGNISLLPAFDRVKTKGTNNNNYRINCSEYVSCLIDDFDFYTTNNSEEYTLHYYPRDEQVIKQKLIEKLTQCSEVDIESCIAKFIEGFNL